MTTLRGVACLLVPLSIFVLWWYVSAQGDAHVENVARFQGFFPGYLQGRLDTAFLGIAYTLPALLISSINLKKTDTFWNSINKIVLIEALSYFS